MKPEGRNISHTIASLRKTILMFVWTMISAAVERGEKNNGKVC
jgi:hypothetical protein